MNRPGQEHVPAYPAARAIAELLYPRFERHLRAARNDGEFGLASVPSASEIETIIDVAFWASLRREEGYVPTISVAFVAPGELPRPLRLEQPLPLSPDVLTRLAAAVERPGVHLGVCMSGESLSVWGATRTVPKYCFVLEVAAPGLLVIKNSRGEESGKFGNVAVLEGDQIKVLSEDAATMPECLPLVRSLLGFDSDADARGDVNVLVQIAASMRAHKRGGSLLVVPARSDAWRESIIPPIRYAVSPPFSEVADLLREQSEERRRRRWQDALRRAVDVIAGFTALDGATILSDSYDLLAFGAKIGRRRGARRVEQVVVSEPIEGNTDEVASLAQLGGTRHLSAAQFAHDQRDSIALVASQDGGFTIFAWSSCEQMVQAHRVESLLL